MPRDGRSTGKPVSSFNNSLSLDDEPIHGLAGNGSRNQNGAAELSATLTQLQKRLTAQQARSPRGSPHKAGTGCRPSSLLLRNAEQQLCELTARLEKAQSRSATVKNSPAKPLVDSASLIATAAAAAAASNSHKVDPWGKTPAANESGSLGVSRLVTRDGVPGMGAPPALLAELEHMRKQLQHASARPLYNSHVHHPLNPAHNHGSSSSSSSSDSDSSTGEEGGRGGRLGIGGASTRVHRKHQGQSQQSALRHRDIALSSLHKAKQPSSIASLQQHLQQLGEAVERGGPYTMRHKPSSGARGDAVAQASAKVNRMGQELCSPCSAAAGHQPVAHAPALGSHYGSKAPPTSSSMDSSKATQKKGQSGQSETSFLTRLTEAANEASAKPPSHDLPPHQPTSCFISPHNPQPPTTANDNGPHQTSLLELHPEPLQPHQQQQPPHQQLSLHGPPCHHSTTLNPELQPPSFFSQHQHRQQTHEPSHSHTNPVQQSAAVPVHLSPCAVAARGGIGQFRLLEPAGVMQGAGAAGSHMHGSGHSNVVALGEGLSHNPPGLLQQQQQQHHYPSKGLHRGETGGSVDAGCGVSGAGMSAGARAREELGLRLQQIREEVERGMGRGGPMNNIRIGGGPVGVQGSGFDSIPDSRGGATDAGEVRLLTQLAGNSCGGQKESGPEGFQLSQRQRVQQQEHEVLQHRLLAENTKLRAQLGEVQGQLQEAQQAQQHQEQQQQQLTAAVPCKQCGISAARLQEAQATNIERSEELASLRIALQEARVQETSHIARLAELQAALDRQARETSNAHAPLIKDLRAIYTAATRRHAAAAASKQPAGQAVDLVDDEEDLDFVALPDPSALAGALHKRVKQLVEEVELQDANLRALESQLNRARVLSGQRALEAEAQVAEAEAARDEAIRQSQRQQRAFEEQLQSLQALREQEVEGLQRKLRASEESLVRAEMEATSQAAQLREYGAALEQKLGRLNEDSLDLRLAKEDAAELRKKVQELRSQVRRAEDSHNELEMAKDQLSELAGTASRQAEQVQVLQDDVRSLRSQLAAERELLARRTSDLEAMRNDLQATLSQLEHATSSKEQLKAQLAELGREAAALKAEAAERTRENIALHQDVAFLKEQASAAEANLKGLMEASSGNLIEENAALKARVEEAQNTLGAWEIDRIRLVESLTNGSKNVEARAQDLEAQLRTALADKEAAHTTAQTMAKDVQSLLTALDEERERSAKAHKEASSAQQSVIEAAQLRTALARMEGSSDELRNQLLQTKQQMESMMSLADSTRLRNQVKDAEEKLSICQTQVEDLKAVEREYQQAIEQMEAELHDSQASAMQATTLVQALREDLAAACSHRDDLAERLDSLEGPQGPLSRVRELEAGLQRERQTCSSLSQQLATASMQCEQLSEELQKKEALVYQLDGTAQILREEVTRLRQQYGEEFV